MTQVPKEVEQLVNVSGNSFHARVAQLLRSNGWAIRVSPYYMDTVQGKAREIDLVAEKSWEIRDPWKNRLEGELVIRLFVECKFVPKFAVFWMAPKDQAAAEKLVIGLGALSRNNTFTRKHHYLAGEGEVAKVFASESDRGPEAEWCYKAINQVLNAQISIGGQPPLLIEKPVGGRKSFVFNYPVVVCNSFDKLYFDYFFEPSSPSNISRNFQLEVQYAFVDSGGRARDEYFLIDFVDAGKWDLFESAVQEGAMAAVTLLEPS